MRVRSIRALLYILVKVSIHIPYTKHGFEHRGHSTSVWKE